ncbi:MAG: hypothetical protein HYV02_07950 [Deltaproteobacteria bacterium]|nr:hypothetical protein [Deltaproteobacteria bacterium]
MRSLVKRYGWNLVVLLSVVAPLHAASAAEPYLEVPIGRFARLVQAVDAAKEASRRLQYPIAEETLRIPATKTRHVGRVVEIFAEPEGTLVVSVLLMSNATGSRERDYYLQQIKTVYPQVVLTPRRLDPAQVTIDPFYAAYAVSQVVILGSYPQYQDALTKVRTLSQASTIPYDARGMVYDRRKGLIWPDRDVDNPFAGSYLARRDNACDTEGPYCLTIERSEFYEGFTPGYYIIVGGIFAADGERQAVEQLLTRIRPHLPDAYVKRTSIYMGCNS